MHSKMTRFLLLWLLVLGSILVSKTTAQAVPQSPNDYPPTIATMSFNELAAGNQAAPDPANSEVEKGSESASDPENLEVDQTSESAPDPADSGTEKGKESQRAVASVIFIAAVACVCVVGCVAFVGGMFCWQKHASLSSSARRVLYQSSDSSVLIRNDYQPMGDESTGNGHVGTNNNMKRLAEKTDYPAYGVTGPNPMYTLKGPPIDVNLNHKAEVFHYQQQKQKLKSVNSASSNGSLRGDSNVSLKDSASLGEVNDEENSDGEYTVYECPGLASTTEGPLEIHNPLFADSETKFTSYTTPTLAGAVDTSNHEYSSIVDRQG